MDSRSSWRLPLLAAMLSCCSRKGGSAFSPPALALQRPLLKTASYSTPSLLLDPVYVPSKTVPTKLHVSSMPMPPQHQHNNNSLLNGFKSVLSKVSKKIQKNEVTFWRCVIGGFFVLLVGFRSIIDVKLAEFWTFLITSPHLAARVFRTDSYEWCLAVSCFAVYIHFFGHADRAVRKADEQGRVHPWKKFRLQDRFLADEHRRNAVTRSVLYGNNNSTEMATTFASNSQPSVKQSEWNWSAWVGEFWVYVLPLLAWDILAPRRHRRIGGFAAPTTMQILGGISAGLLLYDLFFFCGHFLMHKVPFFYRRVHKKHHKVREVRAAEIVRLSIPEEVLEVGFSIVALNLLSVHPLARSMYNIIITFLLTELHCGFDFPWTPQNVIPFGLATGSRRHHYHHRNGKHYYQKFFFTVDRLFGFFQKDDGSLHGDSVKAKPYIPAAWQK